MNHARTVTSSSPHIWIVKDLSISPRSTCERTRVSWLNGPCLMLKEAMNYGRTGVIHHAPTERTRMTESFITLGALRSYTREGRTLILDYGGPRVAITVLTERMIRVRLAPDGRFAARRSWAVARTDDAFPVSSFEIEEPGQALVLRTALLTV